MALHKKIIWKIAVGIVIVIALWFVFYELYWKYQPTLNPKPQYFMTIKGNVSPSLIGKVRLKWVARYASSDVRCDKTYNYIEGVSGWRYMDIPYIAKLSSSGSYALKIPLDYYQSGGYCSWQISEIDDYSGVTSESQYGSLWQFYPCGTSVSCTGLNNIAPNPLIYNLKAVTDNLCHYRNYYQLQCEMLISSSAFSDNANIPRNNSYTFIENYKLSS